MSDARISQIIAPAFHTVHRAMRRGDYREYWLKGGRASTKSCFASVEIVLGMLRDPQANALIYRRVGNTLRDSVYAQMIWAIDMLGLSAYFNYQKSPLEIIYRPTGQRILFRGADDPMKSKSIRLTKGYFKYLWFEELAEFQGMEAIRTIKQSAFRGVDEAITIYSYNPPRSANCWVNDEAIKPRDDRLVHHSTYLDVPVEWLKEAFIAEAESIKATNERAYRNEYLGEVTGNGGNVFENLNLRKIADDEIATMGAFYQGIDWGYFPDPFHWLRCSYNPARRVLYVLDEHRAIKTGNREVYKAIAGRMREDEPMTADSAEPKSINDFRQFGAWWLRPAHKGAGSVAYSMKWLTALSEIVVDPARCPETAKELQKYEYERNAQGEFVSGYPDRNNHGIDALRYATSPIWRIRGE